MAYTGYGAGFGNIFDPMVEGGHRYNELIDPNFGILGPSNFAKTKIKSTCATHGTGNNKCGVYPNCVPCDDTVVTTGDGCPYGKCPGGGCKDSAGNCGTIIKDGECPDGYIGRPPSASCPTCRCIRAATATEEEIKETFDKRFKGAVTTADIGKVRTDPITGQTITSTGISMADAAKNYGLTPEESYRVTYSPYGAEERGQGRGTVYGDPLMSANDARLLRSFVNPYADIGKEFLDPFKQQAASMASGVLAGDKALRGLPFAHKTLNILDAEEEILVDSFSTLKDEEKRVQRTLKRIEDDRKRLEEARRIEEERLLAEANRMRGRQDAGGDDETAEDEKPAKTKKEKPSKTKVIKPTGRSAALALAASLASGKKSPTKSSARGGPGTKSKAAKGRQPRGGQHR